ncbi:ABC transporter ATP-binding protein [Butyrivibrio sp. YAB3001]|uniref:ABC transporter ATP-binding protein n=1 Tax=Butyrivibrio sp. YAB3001 TaxID=1520812 RepID=UPI0008F68B6A|nr:ABC transporter ATP-binding protein [Butyrivibrio sp. YAB3001]SFB85132.1 putative ABC transport system ATP-binding protein [Butyrivibrio sp. YAB3001]
MLLKINGLEKKFTQGSSEVIAVRDLNLEVAKGEFISIIGRSGSGKSTFLNMVAGLLEPTSGSIYLNEREITGLPDKEASFIRNSDIGYIMQGKSLLKNFTVLQNVLLPYYLFKRYGEIVEHARKLLDLVGILHLENAYPSRLSGGELRRVAIARALINQPSLLLADEPTSDLDGENTKEIMKLFRRIADQGTAVIMVTHELDTLKYGDVVYRMDEGLLTITKPATLAV